MATKAKPHWDADSPELRRNLDKVSASIQDDAERRIIPTVATAKAWQKVIDGVSAVIDLAAWAHAEWIRIHPFANGNERTARVWANLLLMRYELPPAVALRPRPGGGYGAAGAAAMRGEWQPTRRVFRGMVLSVVAAAPANAKKVQPP